MQAFGSVSEDMTPDLRVRRAMLLIDLAQPTPPTILAGVVQFAAHNPNWRLSWVSGSMLDGPGAPVSAEGYELDT